MTILRTVLTSVVLFFCYPACAAQQFPSLGEVVSENVNIRAGQSVNFEKLGRLPKGETVTVVQESYGWYKIKAPSSLLCFISRKYVQPLSDGRGVVIGNKVNLRAAPNVNAAQIGQLTKDSVVKIVAQKEDFYQIEPIEGVYGWVSTQFVRLKAGPVPASYPVEKLSSLSQPVVKKSAEEKVVAPVKPVFSLTVSGRLERASDGPHYKVILRDGTIYYINAPAEVMERFLKYEVKVEGTKEKSSSTSAYSTINLSSIKLLL